MKSVVLDYQIELFEETGEIKSALDHNGLAITSIKSLYVWLFHDDKTLMQVKDRLTDTEALALIKTYVQEVEYNLKVALAGIRRAHKEVEKIRQIPMYSNYIPRGKE